MKLKLLTILLLFSCMSIQAQKITLGLNGGINISSQHFKDPFYTKSRSKFGDNSVFPTFGLFGQYAFTKHFSLLADLNYQHKGTAFVETFELLGYDGITEKKENYLENNLHYLQLDLMPKLYLGKRKFKLFVNAGPYIAYLLNATQYGSRRYDIHEYAPVGNGVYQVDHDSIQTVRDRSDNITAAFKRFDYGIQGGIGFEIGRLGLSYRYVYGLPNVFKKEAFFEATNYSHTIKLSFAFFKLGKGKKEEELKSGQ